MADIDAQSLAQYRRDGYIIVEGLLDDLTRQRMKQVLAELIEGARAVTTHDDVYDLEPTHSADAAARAAHQEAASGAPGVRRVHALAAPAGRAERAARAERRAAARLEAQPQVARDTARRWSGTRTGPSIRTPTTTCWPWACCSTTPPNENGPMMVLPGSHRGPTFDHHGADGRFCGAMDPARDGARLRARAVPLIAPAGSLLVPPRARGARLGAEHLGAFAQPAALRVRRGRCLPAARHPRLGRVQRQAAGRRADRRCRAPSTARSACRCRRRRTRARSTRTRRRCSAATSNRRRRPCHGSRPEPFTRRRRHACTHQASGRCWPP